MFFLFCICGSMGIPVVTSCNTVLGAFVTSCDVALPGVKHSPFSVIDVGHSLGEFLSWLVVFVTTLEVLPMLFDFQTMESVLTGYTL